MRDRRIIDYGRPQGGRSRRRLSVLFMIIAVIAVPLLCILWSFLYGLFMRRID